MLFLVTGDIEVSHYEGRTEKPVRKMRLVEADGREAAERKFANHFSRKTSEYAVYYSVHNIDCHETIVDD